MTPEGFFQKFELFAGAPGVLPKMRDLILALAMRGRLSTQERDDEPATELLERIAAKLKKRKIPRDSTSNEIDQHPFDLPRNWRWVRATEPTVGISDQGRKIQTKEILASGNFPVVDQGKVFIRGYCDDATKVIRVTEPIVVFGDHTREVKLIDFDFVVGADGVKLLQPVCIDPRFYYLALRWLPLDSRGYGRHFKLLKAASIPLPPVGEQKRIVAKVDELMGLCGRLETQQKERETRHAALGRASLSRFADAPTLANLTFLFHKSYTITPTDLRKSILTLAVQGKLVPQDPIDGTAEKVLNALSLHKQGALQTAPLPMDSSARMAMRTLFHFRFHRLGQLRGSAKSTIARSTARDSARKSM